MSRSLKVNLKYIKQVKFALLRNNFPSQRALSLELGLALSTVSRFCTGKPVDYSTFVDICNILGLEWRDIADLSHISQVKSTPLQTQASLSDDSNNGKEIAESEGFGSAERVLVEESITATTELELPEGQVQLGSRLYVERPPIESLCYKTIVKPGSLIRIKAPRQMGKSSLMVRILASAIQQNYLVVTINFQLADRKVFHDLDLFLKWFCLTVSKDLNLANETDAYWDVIFGSKMSCNDYFENYLLANTQQPLVLALESVDLVFSHLHLADDFSPYCALGMKKQNGIKSGSNYD